MFLNKISHASVCLPFLFIPFCLCIFQHPERVHSLTLYVGGLLRKRHLTAGNVTRSDWLTNILVAVYWINKYNCDVCQFNVLVLTLYSRCDVRFYDQILLEVMYVKIFWWLYVKWTNIIVMFVSIKCVNMIYELMY